MRIPGFLWDKYILIKSQGATLITELCYGGIIYNALDLPFCSPFVNIRVGKNKYEYRQILKNLHLYLQKDIKAIEDSDYKNGIVFREGMISYPIFTTYDEKVLLHGFHYRSEEEFFFSWKARLSRINGQNIVVFMILYDEDDIKYFDLLPYPRKIGITYLPVESENIIVFSEFNNIKHRYAYSFGSYVNEICRNGIIFRCIDFFNLLSLNLGNENN